MLYPAIKRVLDLFLSIISIILLAPAFLIIILSVVIDSGLPVFYLQKRVGKNFREFRIIKFRTMISGSDKKGLLTVGENDSRITGIGKILRRYKLDELPQLFNVFIGDMSIVGPRPEVKKYVDLYNEEQRHVLSIKPGMTDKASILYFNENEVLSHYSDPEEGYIMEVMPAKLKMNLEYLDQQSLATDFRIMFGTLKRIFS